jgi:hypothetical protein
MHQVREGGVESMIDLSQLSIPDVSVVPEPTAEDATWAAAAFVAGQRGESMVRDYRSFFRCLASLARRCRSLEAVVENYECVMDQTKSAARIAELEADLAASEIKYLAVTQADSERIAELEAEVARRAKQENCGTDNNECHCVDSDFVVGGVKSCAACALARLEAEVERLRKQLANIASIHDALNEEAVKRG